MKCIPFVAAMTLSLSSITYASGSDHSYKGHDGKSYIDKIVKKLELNQDQQSAVKQLHEQYRAEKKALREKHHQDMSEVLNAKQMEKYLKIKKKMKQRKAKKHVEG